jgi:hypothetical protein
MHIIVFVLVVFSTGKNRQSLGASWHWANALFTKR